MTTKTSESMALSHIHTTTDYGLFKSIEGNRNLNLLHLNRLRKSMQERPLFTIITVNEKHEIIDGQHRFEVSKELGLPINYVICAGYGLNEVHIMNANSKTWNADDYLDGYCRMGYQDYLVYRDFRAKYNFGHSETQMILTDAQREGGHLVKQFYAGTFKIGNYKQAVEFAERMELLKPFYENYRRNTFVRAVYTLCRKPQFEFLEFLGKLRLNPSALTDCASVSQYITLIEEIYNYRRREKVNLRY